MALREILAKFGFDVDDKKLLSAKKGIDGLAENVKNLAEKVLGGSVSDVFKEWTGDVKDSMNEFRNLAKMTGTSNQEMQRWTTAAKLGGSTVESLSAGFRVLQKNAAAAAEGSTDAAGGMVDVGDGAIEAVLGSKQAAEAFKSLEVSVKDSKGQMKSATQLMGDVGLEIAKIESPVQRAALATKVFGRRGAELLPIFAKGEEGLSELLDKLDDLGGGVSQEAIDALTKNAKAGKEYDIAITSLKSKVVSAVLPAFTKKVELLTKVASGFLKVTKNSYILEAGILVVSGAIFILQRNAVISGIKTAIAWAPTILMFAAIALLVDDLITLFKGGDSAIGRLIDKIFGMGSAKKVVDTIVGGFGAMSKTIDSLGISGPVALGAVALAIGAIELAASPVLAAILAIGVALAVAAKAAKAVQDLDKKSKGHGFQNFWTNVKYNTGITDFDEFKKQKKELTGEDVLESVRGGRFVEGDVSPEGFTPGGRTNFGADASWAPTVAVPTVAGAGPNQPVTKRIDMKNDVKVIVQGSGDDAVADAARRGVNSAFDDERRASLAALESSK